MIVISAAGEHGRKKGRTRGAAFWPGILLIFLHPLMAAAGGLPPGDDAAHLGVASCASSFCHGSTSAHETGKVLQNEYLTWQREDPHAGAYRLLLNDESARIAQRLGLESAQTADLCLGCHTDNARNTGERFRLDDGIGCETCHGGAEHWIESHAAEDRSHADNLAAGLYPLEQPAARARLCQSCHVGDEERPMLHELLGAGHPPLLFELDTFSAILPRHYEVDDDYRERKGDAGPVDFWVAGQLEQAARYLAQLDRSASQTSNHTSNQVVWPEFANFTCQSCHHTIESDPARPVQTERSGLPTLRTAPLKMLADIATVLAAKDSAAFRAALEDLRRAGKPESESISRLNSVLAGMRSSLGNAGLNPARWRQLLLAVTDTAGLPRGLQSRESVDHRVMAIGVLLQEGRQRQWLSAAEATRLAGALDRSYSLLQDPYAFNAYAVRMSLIELHELAQGLD